MSAIRSPISLWPEPTALGAVTDLYQITMMAGYRAAGLDRSRATFELFVRRLPPRRSYLVFAGLEQAVADLIGLRIAREDVEVLRRWPVFSGIDPAWFDALPDLRFRGDLWSVPEGSVVFPGEPLVRVVADLPEAQWIETYLLASLAYPTLVASKAARIVEAAGGRSLFDFGTRRGHGPLAGLLAARASYLAGFDGTSNVEAAVRLGIPASGTMAHSWVQSFPSEAEAFANFARLYPGSTVLIDTYDILEGARIAARTEPGIGAVRIDSGDLVQASRDVRTILDSEGRGDIGIIVSGDLDEWKIKAILDAGAPIVGFGVGTELITSRDAPALGMVYKLVEQDGQGRVKLSSDKKTYPCAKQVHRGLGPDGRFSGDVVTMADEVAGGAPLLVPILERGRPLASWPGLERVRTHCQSQRAAIPEGLRGVDPAAIYPVSYSDLLEAEADRLMKRG